MMDDARKLCSASKKLEESQRLQLFGHHDSRLIYFFTGKGKQSFEEMVYENVWKAGEQLLQGLANHSGKKAHWSDSTKALMEDGDGHVGAATPSMSRRQSCKCALRSATSAVADPRSWPRPMRKRIGQEVAKGDRQLRRVWLREKNPSSLNSLEGHPPSQFNERNPRPGLRSKQVM